MPEEKKIFARYYIVRGNQALWIGDAAENGARFRQICITSNDWASPFGVFQVYCLQGTSKGLKDGTLQIGPPELLFDGDFQGQGDADRKFNELIEQAKREGFRIPSGIELIEFEAKAQEQRRAKRQ
jgi:GNAT superfamily N-acetyltransferase